MSQGRKPRFTHLSDPPQILALSLSPMLDSGPSRSFSPLQRVLSDRDPPYVAGSELEVAIDQVTESCDDQEYEDDHIHWDYEPRARYRSSKANPHLGALIDHGGDSPVPRDSVPEPGGGAESGPRWTITAPQIERQIGKLQKSLLRGPTNEEIANALGIDQAYYRELLTHLKDVEMGILRVVENGASEEWLAYVPNPSDGDVLFRCLRSEMEALFADAIEQLPTMERLVIEFDFDKDEYTKSIGFKLELPHLAIGALRNSAYLRIRAHLPNPELGERPCKRQLEAGVGERPASSEGRRTQHQSSRWDITTSGSHHGILATHQPWLSFRDCASWERSFTGWYYLDDQQVFTQMRREEEFRLKLNF